jgi:hypothetical protein
MEPCRVCGVHTTLYNGATPVRLNCDERISRERTDRVIERLRGTRDEETAERDPDTQKKRSGPILSPKFSKHYLGNAYVLGSQHSSS